MSRQLVISEWGWSQWSLWSEPGKCLFGHLLTRIVERRTISGVALDGSLGCVCMCNHSTSEHRRITVVVVILKKIGLRHFEPFLWEIDGKALKRNLLVGTL